MEINTDLLLNDFLKSSYQKNTLWLDSKNINKLENCKFAQDWLSQNSGKFSSLLVETPTNSIKNADNPEWIQCIKKINGTSNVQVGYYLPTNLLKDCVNNNLSRSECKKQFLRIAKFLKNIEVSSITFDYLGYDLIKNENLFKDFKWHIWHVNSLNAFNDIVSNENIGIVLLKNNKFTNNLN